MPRIWILNYCKQKGIFLALDNQLLLLPSKTNGCYCMGDSILTAWKSIRIFICLISAVKSGRSVRAILITLYKHVMILHCVNSMISCIFLVAHIVAWIIRRCTSMICTRLLYRLLLKEGQALLVSGGCSRKSCQDRAQVIGLLVYSSSICCWSEGKSHAQLPSKASITIRPTWLRTAGSIIWQQTVGTR